jgi:hypothetical protein
VGVSIVRFLFGLGVALMELCYSGIYDSSSKVGTMHGPTCQAESFDGKSWGGCKPFDGARSLRP